MDHRYGVLYYLQKPWQTYFLRREKYRGKPELESLLLNLVLLSSWMVIVFLVATMFVCIMGHAIRSEKLEYRQYRRIMRIMEQSKKQETEVVVTTLHENDISVNTALIPL